MDVITHTSVWVYNEKLTLQRVNILIHKCSDENTKNGCISTQLWGCMTNKYHKQKYIVIQKHGDLHEDEHKVCM